MSPNLCLRNSHAFSLIESASVLAVVGLVIGGIWIAAASYRNESRVERTYSGIMQGIATLQNIYTPQVAVQLIAGGSAASGFASSILHDMKIFPEDWWQTNCSGYSTPFSSLSGHCGNLEIVTAHVYGTTTLDVELAMRGINRAGCIKLLTRFAREVPRNIASIGFTDNVTDSSINGPIDLTTAAAKCPATAPTGKYAVLEPSSSYTIILWIRFGG